MSEAQIRPARRDDCGRISEIYNYYIKNTAISFEEEGVSIEEMEARMESITRRFPWLVHEEDGVIKGYAYLSAWKERSAYRYTAETTIYVEKNETGKGIGNGLLGNLVEEARRRELHVLMAVIALPNESSIRLHQKYGFRKAAHFKEVGRKFGVWQDVGYWELRLEDSLIGD